jgi:tryptophan synthase alpha chain
VTVGFGIKDDQSARAISRLAEGVVVGSALVNRVVDAAATGAGEQQQISESVRLIGGMRKAIDAA